jgi:hypothetical protein
MFYLTSPAIGIVFDHSSLYALKAAADVPN